MVPGRERMSYTIRLADSRLKVDVVSDGRRFRTGPDTTYVLDGAPASGVINYPRDGGTHSMVIRL